MKSFHIYRFNLKNHLQELPPSGKILVAPLNWGLGHASRCIPIINQLIELGFEPIIASDGAALQFLQKQFPSLTTYELPPYQIKYARNPKLFQWNILMNLPYILNNIKNERLKTIEIINKEKIQGIISDNRFGVHHPDIPSIYITHQLNIKAGIWSYFASLWHQKIINTFHVCWIPDMEKTPNLSGDLSHQVPLKIPMKFIGILSPHQKEDLPILYDLLIILSGVEPSRTIFEQKIIEKYKNSSLRICLIRGIVEPTISENKIGNITTINFAFGKTLQHLYNSSEKIIARTGYSTLMDLMIFQKKALLSPTPGQTEQEYLAKHISKLGLWEIVKQQEF